MASVRVIIDHHTTHRLHLPPCATAHTLLHLLHATHPHLCSAPSRAHVIHLGKLLPHTCTLELPPDSVVHVVHIPAARGRNEAEGGQGEDEEVSVDMHGSVRSVVLGEEEDGSDWMWGFVLAFLLGVIMILLSTDTSIGLSPRLRNGILWGTFGNVIIGIYLLLHT